MSIITARTRALAITFLLSLSLTACFDSDNKRAVGTDPVATPTPPPTTPPVTPPTTPPISAPNQAPTISGTPLTSAKTNQPYAFQPTASDPDGDKITFKVSNKPAWATFDTTTGRLAGTPSSSSTGKFSNITIVASDGTNSVQLEAVRNHGRINGHDRLGDPELAAPDRERRRIAAHQPGGIRHPLWHTSPMRSRRN